MIDDQLKKDGQMNLEDKININSFSIDTGMEAVKAKQVEEGKEIDNITRILGIIIMDTKGILIGKMIRKSC